MEFQLLRSLLRHRLKCYFQCQGRRPLPRRLKWLTRYHPAGVGLPAVIVAAPCVRFTSCKAIKSNGLIKNLQHRATCALCCSALYGRRHDSKLRSMRPIKPAFSPLFIRDQGVPLHFCFLHQILNLIVFLRARRTPPPKTSLDVSNRVFFF